MEVRYIEIKTSPAGQIIRAYTPEQYKKEMARRKNATARARKLTRLQERVGAVLAMLGFLMLLGAGGHPRFGEVIVPHTSNYAAMLNAAEYWGCDWLEIIDDVEVWAVGPDAVPVKMPRHERNGR